MLAEQKAEEERRRKEAEAKQKAEEERRRKEAEAKRKEKRRSDVAEENPYISRIKKRHLFLLVLSVIIVTAVFTCIKIKSEQTRQLSEQARQLSEQARRGFIAFQSSLTNSIGMKFVDIPPGSYKMGSKLSAEEIAKKYGGEVEHRKNEHPRHDVKISEAFYLQTTEVTQGQWKKVMGDNPSNFKDCGDDCPVENVSWNEVKDFIKKLIEMEEGSRYRLPTEAEWEYAARAGTETAFSFGNDPNKIDDYAWWSYNSGGKIHPVGQKNPNAWGLYDMHGNVEEWVEDDDHDNYEGAPDDGRAWVDDPRAYYRVIRGGSYAHRDRNCRSASRWGGHPGWLFSDKDPYIYRGIGFRLSRSVPLGGEAK